MNVELFNAMVFKPLVYFLACAFFVLFFIYIKSTRDFLRDFLKKAGHQWRIRVVLIFVFGILGVISTHYSEPVEFNGSLVPIDVQKELKDSQLLVGLRTAFVLIAGFTGGAQVGLGVGIITGLDRWLTYAGNAGFYSCILAVFIGLCGGYTPKYWLESWQRIIVVALVVTVIQRLDGFWVQPQPYASALFLITFVTFAFINIGACLIFYSIKWVSDSEEIRERDATEKSEQERKKNETDEKNTPDIVKNIENMLQNNEQVKMETDYENLRVAVKYPFHLGKNKEERTVVLKLSEILYVQSNKENRDKTNVQLVNGKIYNECDERIDSWKVRKLPCFMKLRPDTIVNLKHVGGFIHTEGRNEYDNLVTFREGNVKPLESHRDCWKDFSKALSQNKRVKCSSEIKPATNNKSSVTNDLSRVFGSEPTKLKKTRTPRPPQKSL